MRLIRAWSVSHYLRSALAAATLIAAPAAVQSQAGTIIGRVTAGVGQPLVEAQSPGGRAITVHVGDLRGSIYASRCPRRNR